jgi:hypothetical protein
MPFIASLSLLAGNTTLRKTRLFVALSRNKLKTHDFPRHRSLHASATIARFLAFNNTNDVGTPPS